MSTDNVVPLRQPRPCPICGKPSTQAFHPFCSARCADIDLNRWLSGRYVIPGPEKTGNEDDDSLPGSPDDDSDD